jgi:predicted alpha-1,6-mannanase (GH76 family)
MGLGAIHHGGQDVLNHRYYRALFRLLVLLSVLVLAGVIAHDLVAGGAADAAAPATPAASATPAPSGTATPAPSGTVTPAPSGTVTPSATAAASEAALDSFDRAFLSVNLGKASFLDTTGGHAAKFWAQAEMMETVEDAYVRTHKPVYKRMIRQLHDGVVARFSTRWMGDHYNDDIMWMAIAFMRAYNLTGCLAYRSQAKWNFDHAYARAHSADFGGGLWWTTDRHEKNACVTAPAAIAACLLSRSLGDASYLAKARWMFAWLQSTLFDQGTGAVHDHISRGSSGGATVVDTSTYTYNQGTFIGAADLLHRATGKSVYYADALSALGYARTDQTDNNGILKSEGSGCDGGGFKGIFARWATRFTADNRVTAFNAWFDTNADTAWAHRNAQGLMGENWTVVSAGSLHSLDCSSAVVMLQVRP